MNNLQRIVAALALIIVSVYGGMKYHQYQTEQNCNEVGGTMEENGICTKLQENRAEEVESGFGTEFKTVDGKYHFRVLSVGGSPVNEIVLKDEKTNKIYDLFLVEDNKKGDKFQNEELYYLRLTDKKFHWGHQNVVLGSGNR